MPLFKSRAGDKHGGWRGFRAVGYSLDGGVIFKIPIAEIRQSGDGGAPCRISTTVGDAHRTFNGWWSEENKKAWGDKGEPFQNVEEGLTGTVSVEAASGKRVFSGTPFAAHLLYVLLRLRKEGVNPYDASWFLYDTDISRDVSTSFTFFAVADGKIVHEDVSFFRDCPDDGFEPAIFRSPLAGSERIWTDGDHWRIANTVFWYRKFYTETETGQLMVLRPDMPTLYYYERPQAADFANAIRLVTLRKIYRLLLVVIPFLVALVFPSTREFMAIAAAYLGFELLWVCWRTRKVGTVEKVADIK